MAYGLRCFSVGTAYITSEIVFDSTAMDDYLKVTNAGQVSFGSGSTSAAITAEAVDFIHVYAAPSTSNNYSIADEYEIVNRTTNSFKIKRTGSTSTFFFIAFTR